MSNGMDRDETRLRQLNDKYIESVLKSALVQTRFQGEVGWASVLSLRDGLKLRAPHSTVATCSACNYRTCRS
jgi:hypothetical protein